MITPTPDHEKYRFNQDLETVKRAVERLERSRRQSEPLPSSPDQEYRAWQSTSVAS